jgi:adenylate cyclase
MTWPSRAQFKFYRSVVLVSAAVGAPFGYLDSVFSGGSGAHGIVRGAVTGLLTGGPIGALEIFALGGFLREHMRRLPFALHIGLRSVVYAALIVAGLFGGALAVPGVSTGVTTRSVLFSVAVSIGFNLVTGARELLGPGVLFKFVSGRYHRPRVEERVLLFVDLESSTKIAERLGELRFLDFLNRFVADVTDAIVEEGGEIHKYVGDEVIALWRGDDGAGAVRACFTAMSTLARRARLYESEFGQRANFRAGLHAGPVVLGELGYSKMEIALLGDTMNTAARIHELCRETDNRVIASDTLLARAGALPPGVEKRALGPVALRGKERALELYALASR